MYTTPREVCRLLLCFCRTFFRNGLRDAARSIFLHWNWIKLTHNVRRAYFSGRRRTSTPGDEVNYSREIAAIGIPLLDAKLKQHQGKHHHRTELRFLFHDVLWGHGQYYMRHLVQCIGHCGLAVRTFNQKDQLPEVLRDFQPSVLMAADIPGAFTPAELDLLSDYRCSQPLARLYAATCPAGFPENDRLSDADKRRLALCAAGRTADAFYTIYEPDIWHLFLKEWKKTGKGLVSLPLAANPFVHRPAAAGRDLDWVLVANNADFGNRAALTLEFMKDILERHHGILAGENWGRGVVPVNIAGISQLLCRAKIAPNPSVKEAREHPIQIMAKIYELGTSGVFQITGPTKALRRYYAESEAVEARDANDFAALFEHYLHHPEERHTIAVNALRKTIERETYFDRIDLLVGALDAHPGWFKPSAT